MTEGEKRAGAEANSVSVICRRGAEEGLWFGLYLSVTFVALAMSLRSDPAGLLAIVLAAGVPFVTYAVLRRGYRESGFTEQFSATWLHGISLFFFGSLLMSVAVYVYLRVYDPDYYVTLLTTAADYYRTTGTADGERLARMIVQVRDGGMLPTAAATATDMIMGAVFSGSLLSLVAAAAVRVTTRRRTPPPLNGMN